MVMEKSGFLYVYTSNESVQDVYFDNVTVAMQSGPVLEETHYYPFGLTMAGISSNALRGKNYPENRRRFNGIEQTTDLNLNQYDAFYRTMDPQLGRWWQSDPKPNMAESPYSAMGNNPIRYSDFLGDTLLTKADHRMANRITKQINSVNSRLNKQATKLNSQISKADAKGNTSRANNLRTRLNDVNARVSTNNNTLSNLNAITTDQTQAYTFNQLPVGSSTGLTELKTMSVNGNNQDVIVMNVTSNVNAVHELTHAYQGGVMHLFSFIPNQQSVSFPGSNLFTQQMANTISEEQAYQAQHTLDPSSMPPSVGGYVPNSINSVNALYIGGINQTGTNTPVYPNVQNMVNTIMQLIRIP